MQEVVASNSNTRPREDFGVVVVVLYLIVEMGVGMERQDLSYEEVVSTRCLRVQALLGGSNSPMSRCPEVVDWIICVGLQRVRTLVPEEGGGLYRVRQDPSPPPLQGN